MRNIIWMLLMTGVSSGAMAEWVNLGSTGDNNVTFFAEPTSITKTGNMVKMWYLQDLATPRLKLCGNSLAARSRLL